jgi:hypothetical protein
VTAVEQDRFRDLKRTHQRLLRDWKRKKGPCIICAEREGKAADHLPPKVLFPESIRTPNAEFFTFPVCQQCNNASKDEDFLFSVLLSFGLNQEAIINNQEPSDPDLLALYRQTHGHFQNSREAARRTRLLKAIVVKDPQTGMPAIDFRRVPLNQTLTKIAKSIYWLYTGGDIIQRYKPGWWILSNVDTSKEHFIEKHLKTSHADVHWGERFIYHYTIGHTENDMGGFILGSLHFYTRRAVGQGMSWMVIASPTLTSVNGKSLYEWCTSIWGAATIDPKHGS